MHDDELHRFKSGIHFLKYAAERYGYQRDRRERQRLEPRAPPSSDGRQDRRAPRPATGTGPTLRSATIATTAPRVELIRNGTDASLLGSVREELRSWLGMARPVPQALEPPRRSLPAQQRPFAEVFAGGACVASDMRLPLQSRGPSPMRPCRIRALRRAPGASTRREYVVLFDHRDDTGTLTGFEVKNRKIHEGFAAGGSKSAWQSASRQ